MAKVVCTPLGGHSQHVPAAASIRHKQIVCAVKSQTLGAFNPAGKVSAPRSEVNYQDARLCNAGQYIACAVKSQT